jgi:hypothetical protein
VLVFPWSSAPTLTSGSPTYSLFGSSLA